LTHQLRKSVDVFYDRLRAHALGRGTEAMLDVEMMITIAEANVIKKKASADTRYKISCAARNLLRVQKGLLFCKEEKV